MYIDSSKLKARIVLSPVNDGKFQWRLFIGWGKKATARSPIFYNEPHRCRIRAKEFIKRLPFEVVIEDKIVDGRKRNVEA